MRSANEQTPHEAGCKVSAWFDDVKVGDMLRPIPLWNHTERAGRCLDSPTEVLKVIVCGSQSGVCFEVKTKNGNRRQLDAAWFQEPSK